MSPSIQFRLALGISFVIILSVIFALIATGEATRLSIREQGAVDLQASISDVSQTLDMYLNLVSDQVQAAATDPVLKSRLLELAPREQPPGLEAEAEEEQNLAKANRYFQSNQPAMFARQQIVAIADTSRRLVFISTRPGYFGPLAFPSLLIRADSQGIGVAVPAQSELAMIAAAPDLLDKKTQGLIFVAVPIFSAEQKIGYIVVANSVMPWLQTWDSRLKVKSAIRIGSEFYYPSALKDAEGDSVRADGKLRIGEIQLERNVSGQIEPIISRLRRALFWSLPFNWAIGLIVVVLMSRSLIKSQARKPRF